MRDVSTPGGAGSGGIPNSSDSPSRGGDESTAGAISSGGVDPGGAAGTGGTADTGGAAGLGGDGGAGGDATAGQAGRGGAGQDFDVCDTAPPVGTRVATIHLIGDSTASSYASNVYPRMGWGQLLGEDYSPACAVVSNQALSGRSSKSFFDEGAWTPVRGALLAGDFVLIQFGHNDEKSDDPARYTEPQTTYKQYLTTYIQETRAQRATPVLVTSIHRNNWDGTTVRDSHGDYPPAMRELALELDVALIDLTALTKTHFERIGPAATNDLFMNLHPGEFPNYPDGNSDNTHLREAGARVVAQLLNYDAHLQQLPFARLLGAVPVAP